MSNDNSGDKINIERLKNLIKETKMEREYYEKFVEGFEDVRELGLLSEAELQAAADELYRFVFGAPKNKKENNS